MLWVVANGGFNIFVQVMGGKSLLVQVSNSSIVHDVKTFLYRKCSIPANSHCLLFDGKQLLDECLLYDYDIVRDCTVQVVLRLRGRMPRIK